MKLIYFRLTIFLGLLTVSMSFTSCKNCNQNDRPERLREASFGFVILDSKTNKNLFSNLAYSIDSVKLLGGNNPLRKARNGADGYIFAIDSVYVTSQNRIGQLVERTYYIYLNQSDTDTLKISFLPSQGECEQYFKDYQVFYNQRLITTGQNVISFSTNINKL